MRSRIFVDATLRPNEVSVRAPNYDDLRRSSRVRMLMGTRVKKKARNIQCEEGDLNYENLPQSQAKS